MQRKNLEKYKQEHLGTASKASPTEPVTLEEDYYALRRLSKVLFMCPICHKNVLAAESVGSAAGVDKRVVQTEVCDCYSEDEYISLPADAARCLSRANAEGLTRTVATNTAKAIIANKFH